MIYFIRPYLWKYSVISCSTNYFGLWRNMNFKKSRKYKDKNKDFRKQSKIENGAFIRKKIYALVLPIVNLNIHDLLIQFRFTFPFPFFPFLYFILRYLDLDLDFIFFFNFLILFDFLFHCLQLLQGLAGLKALENFFNQYLFI